MANRRVFSCTELDTDRPRVSLDGSWDFCYDPDGVGVNQRWFRAGQRLPERIAVPGCSQVRRYRSARGNVRVTDVALPEQSSTIMLRHGCLHPSWYKKTFVVPARWQGRLVELHVGGVKPAGEFWVNGHRLGATVTSRSPVRCDLTRWIRFGRENTLAVRVWWPRTRLDGVYDVWHAWSGLYRSVWVEAVPGEHIADVHVRPSIRPRAALVAVRVRAGDGRTGALRCAVEIAPAPRPALSRSAAAAAARKTGRREPIPDSKRYQRVVAVEDGGVTGGGVRPVDPGLSPGDVVGRPGDAGGDPAGAADGVVTVTLRVPMPGAALWSIGRPALHRATVRVFDGGRLLDTGSVRFGLREVRVRGPRILLNGVPVFLRGGCDDRVYPDTVCPPADKRLYLARLRRAKRYGFNYTKSACEVFTREFLDAADEAGYLVCQEMPFGMLGDLRARRDHPSPALVDLWRRELANMVAFDRNHPSVAVYSMASELAVNLDNPAPYRVFSRALPAIARRLNPAALVMDTTAGYCLSTRTRHGRRDTDLIEDCPEWSFCLTPLQGPLRLPGGIDRPFLLHEWNWITQLPDPRRARRFARSPLVPLQISEMVAAARRGGLAAELPAMVRASRRLKYALRKDAHEQAYEHPRVAGYHGWLIHDVPYCPEGVFNEDWDAPADLPAAEFRTYNGETVLVLDDRDRRCFEYGGPVPLGVRVAHFGGEPLHRAVIRWSLLQGRRAVAAGRCALGRVGCGQRAGVADLGVPPVRGTTPAVGELRAELWEGGRRVAWNHWPLWLFPAAGDNPLPRGIASTVPGLRQIFAGIGAPYDPLGAPSDGEVFITHRLTDAGGGPIEGTIRWLEARGRVLWLHQGELPEAESCLYRTVPYNMGTVGNMGTVIHPHPVLGDFPHDGWCDLPFVPLIAGAYPVRLDSFGAGRVRPIIRSTGHQVTMEDKAYLFEFAVGRGTLLVCSLQLASASPQHPAARYLLRQMLGYLAGGRCRPWNRLSADRLRAALGRRSARA